MMRKITVWNGEERVEVLVECRSVRPRLRPKTVVDPQRDFTGEFARWYEQKTGKALGLGRWAENPNS